MLAQILLKCWIHRALLQWDSTYCWEFVTSALVVCMQSEGLGCPSLELSPPGPLPWLGRDSHGVGRLGSMRLRNHEDRCNEKGGRDAYSWNRVPASILGAGTSSVLGGVLSCATQSGKSWAYPILEEKGAVCIIQGALEKWEQQKICRYMYMCVYIFM